MNFITNSRKTRCDSVLDALTNEQKERLGRWLGEENRGYEEVRQLAATEFGVATSRSALSRYFRRCAATRTAGNTELGVSGLGFGVETVDAEQLEAWRGVPAETGRLLQDAALTRARQLAFHAIADRDPDLKRVARLMGIVRELERQQIERVRVELEERRVALKERAVANAEVPKAERGARNAEVEMRNGDNGARKAEVAEMANAKGGGAVDEAAKVVRQMVPADAYGEASLPELADAEPGASSSMSRIIFDRAA